MAILQAMSSIDVRALLLGILTAVFLLWLVRRPRNLPPGPWGWPLLGYLPQLAMIKVPTYEALTELGRRYGPVYSFYLTNQLVVVLQDFDVMKKALSTYQLSGRPTYQISQRTLPGHGVMSASGEKWLELRKFSVTTLRGLGMAKSSFEKQISLEVECCLEEIRKKKGQEFDPNYILDSAVANVVCLVVFGKRFEYTDPTYIELLSITNMLNELLSAGGALEFIPVFAKLTFLPIVRKQIAVNERLMVIFKKVMDDHNEDYQPGVSRDYIDAFCNEMQLKGEQGATTYMDTATLYYSISGLFGAGGETLTSTLRWALLYMVAYPEVQTHVQQELDRVVGRDRQPEIADKPQLPYTLAVLCEIQRIGNVVPLGVPHRCMEDTTILGYHIPEGAIVLTNLWDLHRDGTVWTNPEEFKPERFLDSDGNFRSSDRLVPFGIGRRICLGENLARMELFIFFTFLLQQFIFEPPEGAAGVSFATQEGITLAPAPYTIRAIPRV